MSRSRQNTSVTMMNKVSRERPMRFARYCTIVCTSHFSFEIQIRIEYRNFLILKSDLKILEQKLLKRRWETPSVTAAKQTEGVPLP